MRPQHSLERPYVPHVRCDDVQVVVRIQMPVVKRDDGAALDVRNEQLRPAGEPRHDAVDGAVPPLGVAPSDVPGAERVLVRSEVSPELGVKVEVNEPAVVGVRIDERGAAPRHRPVLPDVARTGERENPVGLDGQRISGADVDAVGPGRDADPDPAAGRLERREVCLEAAQERVRRACVEQPRPVADGDPRDGLDRFTVGLAPEQAAGEVGQHVGRDDRLPGEERRRSPEWVCPLDREHGRVGVDVALERCRAVHVDRVEQAEPPRDERPQRAAVAVLHPAVGADVRQPPAQPEQVQTPLDERDVQVGPVVDGCEGPAIDREQGAVDVVLAEVRRVAHNHVEQPTERRQKEIAADEPAVQQGVGGSRAEAVLDEPLRQLGARGLVRTPVDFDGSDRVAEVAERGRRGSAPRRPRAQQPIHCLEQKNAAPERRLEQTAPSEVCGVRISGQVHHEPGDRRDRVDGSPRRAAGRRQCGERCFDSRSVGRRTEQRRLGQQMHDGRKIGASEDIRTRRSIQRERPRPLPVETRLSAAPEALRWRASARSGA